MKLNNLRTFFAVAALLLLPAVHAAKPANAGQAIALDTPTGKLAGTLLLPAASGPVPVALIIAGSGPTDRNGNSAAFSNDSLKLLAHALGEAGYASLRYDKRGIGASAAAGPSEAAMRFENYVDDAAAWLELLGRDPRFSSVVVIGHSEGALIGMLAARKGRAAAFISIAGAASGAADILRRQLASKLTGELASENERLLTSLQKGEQSTVVPPALAALYRPSVQPYLISWFKYVPAERIATLAIPVLVVQGTTDLQVPVSEAQALHKASPGSALAILPGVNHVLKEVPADMQAQLASYANPALPLAPALSAAVTDFLARLCVQKRAGCAAPMN